MSTIQPDHPLRGAANLPGDKSLSHRAALFAALADGESRIDNFLFSGVTQAMLTALTALGVEWELDGVRLRVAGRGLAGLKIPTAPLDCRNSGTTLRLLAGALSAAGVPAVLDGSPGLRRRPMGRILEPLGRMGVPIQAAPGATAPLILPARPAAQALHAIDFSLPVASAQVKTALLLAGLAADGATTLREPGPSRDHSERMLATMGACLEGWHESDALAPYLTRIYPLPAGVGLQPLNLRLPGDISSAAFLIVAVLITPGSEITIENVGLNPTRSGLLEALQAMGAHLEITPRPDQAGEPCGDIRAHFSVLSGCNISGDLVVRMIDEFPAFAIAAAWALGQTTVRDAQELRYKESDRISALCIELRRLGVDIHETPDGFVLNGGKPIGGGVFDSHGDHRLAMAGTLAGLAATAPVQIAGAEIIAESFPQFVPILRGLGARIA